MLLLVDIIKCLFTQFKEIKRYSYVVEFLFVSNEGMFKNGIKLFGCDMGSELCCLRFQIHFQPYFLMFQRINLQLKILQVKVT